MSSSGRVYVWVCVLVGDVVSIRWRGVVCSGVRRRDDAYVQLGGREAESSGFNQCVVASGVSK